MTAIDFSTDGSSLAILDKSGVGVMVDAQTLDPFGTPVQLEDLPCAVSLGPDNRTAFVATGAPKAAWDFWYVGCSGWALVDLESGTVLDRGAVETEDGREIDQIDFSPLGDRVVVSVAQNVVVLDAETGRPLRPPVAAHDAALLSLAYSSDGKQLLTSAADASTALWDAQTGRLVARVVTPSFLSTAQFAEGGSVVVADGFVGAVYRWDTRPDYAVEFACRLAGRDLTQAEWADQFGDRNFQETCPS